MWEAIVRRDEKKRWEGRDVRVGEWERERETKRHSRKARDGTERRGERVGGGKKEGEMRNEKEEKVWEALPQSWGELGNLFLFARHESW